MSLHPWKSSLICSIDSKMNCVCSTSVYMSEVYIYLQKCNQNLETQKLYYYPMNSVFQNLSKKWEKNACGCYLFVLDKVMDFFGTTTSAKADVTEMNLTPQQCKTLLNEIEMLTCMNKRDPASVNVPESIRYIQIVREELDQFIRICLRAYQTDCHYKMVYFDPYANTYIDPDED